MRIQLVVACLLMAAAPAHGQVLTGDAAAGRALAVQTCATCHAVADRQAQPAMDAVPAFATLARDPAVTELRLRAFLQNPHGQMPNLALSRREIDDVVSYILSLRRQ
ncbi:MAG: cytochrome c [Proteobacteria bacterium]|nr:cytochrome c [Pseudomonadota bacterium]